MKTILIILVLLIGFSCQTNHYLSEPIKGIPAGLLNSLKTNEILLATDYKLKTDTAYLEECLDGVKLNINAKSNTKIIDNLRFLKRPNAAIFDELKTTYHADGLLLLTKLYVKKQCFDVPSKQLYYFPASHGGYAHPAYYAPMPRTNLYIKITSQWEYHDFTSGKSYLFSVENDKMVELEDQVEDKDAYLDSNYKLVKSMLYRNGSMTASRFIESDDMN